jgi:hypothetical protein
MQWKRASQISDDIRVNLCEHFLSSNKPTSTLSLNKMHIPGVMLLNDKHIYDAFKANSLTQMHRERS